MCSVLAGVLIACLSFGLGACSSGPSTLDRAVCSSGGRAMGAPPGSIDIDMPAYTHLPEPSDGQLASAYQQWVTALQKQNQAAASRALGQIEQACSRLSIWKVYH
jgi:hypothetical protein